MYLCSSYSFSEFRTKRLGWVLKILLVLCLPLPLVLWPTIVIVASILGGIAYGFFAPLIATFEFIGRDTTEKTLHCFIVSLSFHYIYEHVLIFLAYIPSRQFPGHTK